MKEEEEEEDEEEEDEEEEDEDIASNEKSLEYNKTRVHRSTRKRSREQVLLQDWKIDEAVESALNTLFRDGRYLPADPYKTLISVFRRKQRSSELPKPVAWLDLPRRYEVPSSIDTTEGAFRFTKFRKSNIVGLVHITKLCDPSGLADLEQIVKKLNIELGNLPNHVEREDNRLHFIEVPIIDTFGALSCGLATPRAHFLLIHVEGVVQGPNLDSCLVLFIRRVFEEIDKTRQSSDIISSGCKVLSGSGIASSFRLSDMLHQKELVLSTMKSAILNGGRIFLDLFMRVNRKLPPELYSQTHGAETNDEASLGIIRIRREYRFSYRSSSSKSKGDGSKKASKIKELKSRYRCFAEYPLDSLIRGVFLSLKEITLYIKACSDHSHQQGHQQNVGTMSKAEKKAFDASRDALMIDHMLKHYASSALTQLEESRVVDSATVMLVLHAFLASSGIKFETKSRDKFKKISESESGVLEKDIHVPEHSVARVIPSFCQRQLRCLTSGLPGRSRAIEEAVEALIGCIHLLLNAKLNVSNAEVITANSTNRSKQDPKQVSEESTSMEEICRFYDSSLLAIVELRQMLLALHRDLPSVVSSDGNALLPLLLEQMGALFQKRHLSRPVLPSSFMVRRKYIAEDLFSIQQELLKNVKLALPILEKVHVGMTFLSCCSVTDTVLELIQMDTDAFHRYKTPYKKKTMRKLANGTITDYSGSLSYSLNIAPMTFSDLLGYCDAAIHAKSRNDTWKAYTPRLLTRYLVDRNVSDYYSFEFSRSLSLERMVALEDMLVSEAPRMISEHPRRRSVLQQAISKNIITSHSDPLVPDTMELMSALQLNSTGRHGVVDGLSSLEDEMHRRHEVPACMAGEAVKIRYLCEAQATKAMEDAFFAVMVSPEVMNPFVYLCQHMSPFSAYNQLWRSTDEDVMRLVLAHILHPPVSLPHSPAVHKRLGYYKIPLGEWKGKLRGGLVGLPNVIDMIFTNWKVVFANLWSLPPIIPNYPRASVSMEVYCGASIETAMRWGLAESSLFPIRAEQLPPKPHAEPFLFLIKENRMERMARLEKAKQSSTGQHKSSSRSLQPNTDLNALSYPGKCQLEVVCKAFHEIPSQVPTIREIFASQVEECFHELTRSSMWRVRQIRVPVTAQVNGVLTTREVKFTSTRLSSDKQYMQSLKARVVKSGMVYVDAAAVMSDASGQQAGGMTGAMLSFEDLIHVLSGKGSSYQTSHDTKANSGGGGSGPKKKSEHMAAVRIDEDSTASDVSRLVVGTPVSNTVDHTIRQQSKASVYVPITLHLSLLATIRGLSFPPNEKKKTDPLSDLLSAEKNRLTIGSPELISRLVCSTVWVSRIAGDEIWSCARQAESRQNCILFEAESHMETARMHCNARNLVDAYEQLGMSSIIGSDYITSPSSGQEQQNKNTPPTPWGNRFEVVPAMLRMRHSLAGKLHRLIDCVEMVSWVLSSASEAVTGSGLGDGFNSINYKALLHTITRHVCLALRMVVMAPQCVHYRGGCLYLLRRVLDLEASLRIGRLPLSDGHILFESTGKAPTCSLSMNLPTPLLSIEESNEMKQEKLEVDPLGMFRRAFTAQKSDQSAVRILSDISSMSHFLLQTLAEDVHKNTPHHIRNLLTFSSRSRLLNPSLATEEHHPSEKGDVPSNMATCAPRVKAALWKKTKNAFRFLQQPSVDSRPSRSSDQLEQVVTAKDAMHEEAGMRKFLLQKSFSQVHKQLRGVKSMQRVVDERRKGRDVMLQSVQEEEESPMQQSNYPSSDGLAQFEDHDFNTVVSELTISDMGRGDQQTQIDDDEEATLVSMPSAVSFPLEEDFVDDDPPDAEEVIEGHDLEIESLQGEVISSPTRNRRRSRDNGVTLSSVEAAEKAATVGLAALAASNLARQREEEVERQRQSDTSIAMQFQRQSQRQGGSTRKKRSEESKSMLEALRVRDA